MKTKNFSRDTVILMVLHIVADHFGVTVDKVAPVTSVFTDMCGDSLDFDEIFLAVEQDFLVEAAYQEPRDITVREIVDQVCELLREDRRLVEE